MRTILGEELPFDQQVEQLAEPRKIIIQDKERRSGMYILGVQGIGKSFLLAHLILQDLLKGYAVIVFDAHGDLIRHVISLLPPERLNKTYLLDLTDIEHPFGLNLFACSDPTDELERAKVVERVMHVFERIWPESKGILLGKMLRYITLAFLECPECTLADVPRLIWDDTFRASIVSRLTNEEVKAYWRVEFSAMKPGEKRKEVQALENRLATFLATPFIRNIVCQKNTTIDFRHVIQDHEVLLVNLPMKELKEHAALIGTIVLTQIHAATFSFGEVAWDQRPGFSLFVDEWQNFATTDFAELFKEGRKYGARITVAHQDRRDLLPENRSATLTASITALFRPTAADAAELAPLLLDATIKLRPTVIYPDVLSRIRNHEQEDVQRFYRQYILPFQIEHREKGRKYLLELLRDLIYQAVKTGVINEQVFADCVERMYPLLNLTLAAPEQKRKQLGEKLQQHEKNIAKLASFLTSEQAFRGYLVAYHSYYSAHAWNYRIPWSDQPFVSDKVLLKDAAFWRYVLSDESDPPRERFEAITKRLERYTLENDALSQRDTVEKIIALEREKQVDWPGRSLRTIWEKIAAIHELKSRRASNAAVRAFHANVHRACLAVPLAQKGDPVYLHPVGSHAGTISDGTKIDELLIQPLSFTWLNREEAAAWLANPRGQPVGRGEVMAEEAAQARTTVMALWSDILKVLAMRQQANEKLGDDASVLQRYYAELASYPSMQSLWYEYSGGDRDANVWDMVKKEAQRNAYRSGQLNAVEKLNQSRKDELQRKIALLITERDAFKTTLPPLKKRIQQEEDEIEQRRAAFRSAIRHVILHLIDDPGLLGEERTLRESDIKEMLLNLPKRQALVRVGGSLDLGPRKCRLRTSDLPQAAKRDEVERRLYQIRRQTRAKYCRPRSEVERELGSRPTNVSPDSEEGREDWPLDSWYEE